MKSQKASGRRQATMIQRYVPSLCEGHEVVVAAAAEGDALVGAAESEEVGRLHGRSRYTATATSPISSAHSPR